MLNALEASLSADRLTSYLQATGGERERAVRLYAWNATVSAALYVPLQGLEVTLRNALHRELTATFGQQWYDNPAARLSSYEIGRVGKAKSIIARARKPVDPPHVVAELSFGFWVSLLGPGPKASYEMQLWRPALHKAFPHTRLPRKEVHKPLNYLRTLRNRIAHHEPIFRRHLEADYRNIIEVIEWICPDTAAWVEHHNAFRETMAAKP